jgi:hypothetical protein
MATQWREGSDPLRRIYTNRRPVPRMLDDPMSPTRYLRYANDLHANCRRKLLL